MADQNQDELYFSDSSADDLGQLDVREFARTTRIINIWLAALSIKSGVRSYIDALIGLSDGEDTFECVDLTVAAYACPEDFIDADIKLEIGKQTKTIAALQARVRQQRKRLIDAQTRADVTLIQIVPGDKIRGKQFPTHYTMILFDMIRDVQHRIMKRASVFNKNPRQVLTEIAMSVLREGKGAGVPAKIERRKRRPMSREDARKIAGAWIKRTFYMASQENVTDTESAAWFLELLEAEVNKNRIATGKKIYE